MAMRVLDPTAEVESLLSNKVDRLGSLQDRTIGLLDNGKIRVHELLNEMEEILVSQHGVAKVLRFSKPDASRPVPDDVVAEMKECDAIISAVGD